VAISKKQNQCASLIVGLANEHSIAFGCAKALAAQGVQLIVTYQSEKSLPYIEPLLPELGNPLLLPCDVTIEGSLEGVFDTIRQRYERLDSVIHAIAFAPREDLHGRVTDCSRAGFLTAMDISCHSFVRMAALAEPLMTTGGTLIAMTYYGSEKVVSGYNMMGPVKAALESVVRYLAAELGEKSIRVHAVSPGPLRTRAAMGLKNFERLLAKAAETAPLHQLVTIDDVGAMVAFLTSPAAFRLSGEVIYVDGGYHVMD
jgi:enoyl-[acyl-carrier protein] reductase I